MIIHRHAPLTELKKKFGRSFRKALADGHSNLVHHIQELHTQRCHAWDMVKDCLLFPGSYTVSRGYAALNASINCDRKHGRIHEEALYCSCKLCLTRTIRMRMCCLPSNLDHYERTRQSFSMYLLFTADSNVNIWLDSPPAERFKLQLTGSNVD